MITFLHYLYWFIIFFHGVFIMLNIPSSWNKVVAPIVLLVLLLISIAKVSRFKTPYLLWFISFVIISLISFFSNDIDIFSMIYFLRYTIMSYLYFLVIVNENKIRIIKNVYKFIIILMVLQIPAIIIKYLVLGISEHGGIGTLSVNSGSVSTTFPMLIFAFFLSYYFFKKKILYIVVLLGFVIFGIVGGKRAIIFFLPLVLLITYFLYMWLVQKKTLFIFSKEFITMLLLAVFSIIAIAIVTPSLNPERIVGGSFDSDHIFNFTEKYTSSKGRGHSEMRRKDGLVYFSELIIQKSDPYRLLFGDGSGKLVVSRFKDDSGRMKEQYGVRYGGRMGFIWILLQVGLFGSIIFFSFFIKSGFFVFKNFKPHPFYLAYLVLIIIFFIDVISYSTSFILYEYTKGLIFALFAILYNDIKSKGLFLAKFDTL